MTAPETTVDRFPPAPHGAYSRIAREVDPSVTLQHVRAVWRGERRSKRIEEAISKFLASSQESGATEQ